MIKSEVKRYLKRVKGSLPCSFTAKRAFISMLKSQISDFLEEFPDSSIDSVIKQFGTPESIASEFNVNEYTAEIKKYRIKTTFFVLLSVILLIGCIFLMILLTEAIDGGHITITNDYPKPK